MFKLCFSKNQPNINVTTMNNKYTDDIIKQNYVLINKIREQLNGRKYKKNK